MSELMSLEEINKSWSDYLDELDPSHLEMSRLCETARDAHEYKQHYELLVQNYEAAEGFNNILKAENEKLRELLSTARTDERERAVKILENLNTIIGHPCMIAEAIEEVRALGDTK